MGVHKEASADLQRNYPLYVEIGLVLALLLLILAFRIDIRAERDFEIVMEQQEVVQMEEILQTEQQMKPPPPPRPPVPVEVPNDAIIEDEPLDLDASLDLDEALDVPTPPPPPSKEEEREEPEVFIVVEERPKLIGGLSALQEAVEYPEFAKKAGIEGAVFVQFIVDERGQVTNVQVTRGVHKLLDEAAVEAVRKMRFEPGKQRGKPVKVQMSLPVRFYLR
ncbi:MAG: TonB family protein [Bacteroidetes bacterium]|jgi:protein TonB|nr:TonB family protein [Bacteroidota bacterium]